MARKRLGPARGLMDPPFGAEAGLTPDLATSLPGDAGFDSGFDPGFDPGFQSGADHGARAPETKAMFPLGVARTRSSGGPPISQVTAEAAALAAAEALAEDLRQARESGRLLLQLPLDQVADGWLLRDRLARDDEAAAALLASLRERGQQVPIEVVDLGEDHPGGRYGLISGWRRLMALRQLQAEAGGSDTVLAVLRRPESQAAAYRAMVEENEIRHGLSYYERARIVVEAAARGIFADRAAALAGLFASASRARRSKIGSFARIHLALGDRLGFGPAIPERLGLVLARALEDEGFAAKLRERLRKSAPPSAEAELALIERALEGLQTDGAAAAQGQGPVRQGPVGQGPVGQGGTRAAPDPAQAPTSQAPGTAAQGAAAGIVLRRQGGRLVLEGPGLNPDFEADLRAWLQAR